MKKSKKHRGYDWLSTAALLLIFTFFAAFIWSYGGFAISVHIGVRTQNTASISEVCTKVEISKRDYSLKGYGGSESKVYDFYLSNGESYRICCTDLWDDGITDEQLQSLEGSIVTVEYVTTRLTHETYPLLSLKDENGVIISKQIALKYWGYSWGAAYFALYTGGGSSIAIILCNVIFIIVRTTKKNARIRRKKMRRKKQLEERMQKKGSSENDTT